MRQRVEQVAQPADLGARRAVGHLAVLGADGRQPAVAALIAADGSGLLVVSTLEPRLPGEAETQAIDRSTQLLRTTDEGLPGATARTGSIDQLVDEITRQVEVDLRTGEGIALPISLLVMVLVFGGFLAAGMPLAGAIASIGGALASLYGFSYGSSTSTPPWSTSSRSSGLGLCIDYGLLIVSRFREELHALDAGGASATDHEAGRRIVEVALGRTVAHAGRTVLFSALIVGISLSGLLFFQADDPAGRSAPPGSASWSSRCWSP